MAALKDTSEQADLAVGNAVLPSGIMLEYGAAGAPAGWLPCDGAAVSRATYAALFAAIGTTYGVGDGSTTFNVPDAQGRSLVGQGTHADVDALGDSEGLANASRTPYHVHAPGALNVAIPGHWHSKGTLVLSGESAAHDHYVSYWAGPGSHPTNNLLSTVSTTVGNFASSGANTGHGHGFAGNAGHVAGPSGDSTINATPAGATGANTPAYQVVDYIIKT